MTATVRLSASALGSGVIQTINSGAVVPAADGTITVNALDVPSLLAAGCEYIIQSTESQRVSAPRAQSAGRIVASTALANGTIAIANQPDSPRQCDLYVEPGGGTITAGNAALVYIANDGTTQTDNFSLINTSTVAWSSRTSKGVLHVNSITISALAGGTSPQVQVNDTNALSMMVNPGFIDFTVLKENVDAANEAVGTVASSAASVVPTTTPNATHNYDFFYSFNAPNI